MPHCRLRSACAAVLLAALALACGRHEGPGTIEGKRVPDAVIAQRAEAEQTAARTLAERSVTPAPAEQILFGDLHVHTTYSADAFMMGLPVLQGEGVHPIADACDYARYCSALDFWSITDHAEAITPARWRETKDTVRQCNALAGDPANPDLVTFLGWEWTQIGKTPKDHYGHKNVILRDTDEDRVPRRPINAAAFAAGAMRQRVPLGQRLILPLLDWPNRQMYWNLMEFQRELRDTPMCPEGVDTKELPESCAESAATPQQLYQKLDQWGFPALVIPHGTTWGLYTPPGSSWDKQLTPEQHDPSRQRLIEVYSGHGNSEEYRDWSAVEYDAAGNAVCPAPRDGYEACCWRAGEIIRERCDDRSSPLCEQRVAEARANYLAAGVQGRFTVPGTQVADWGNCGSCPDCFLASYNYRPQSSVQYTLALTNFDVRGQPERSSGDPQARGRAPGEPMRFRFGFIASSDNHTARPGTGYKEVGRIPNTEARGAIDPAWRKRFVPQSDEAPAPESVPFDSNSRAIQAFQALDFERQASFFLTGGLVATHAAGRSREAIWDALQHRDVYGTSGERILLWFDLLNGPQGPLPMGSETRLGENPRFRVRAAGSFKQKPGCPEVSTQGLSPERLARLCRGECYNPSDERHVITRIEVVRIRPRVRPDEPLRPLIQDPWRSIPCPYDAAGCSVEFEDPEFSAGRREAIYYVRAIQEPSPVVNGAGLRCTYDAEGRCIEVHPCYGDYRTPASDDCLAPAEERAWSSPIFVSAAN
jgi:hypothetical protein